MIGPTIRTPRPLGEAPLARRAAMVAMSFFLASAAALAARGTDLGDLLATFPLYALGGFGILIFGTSRLLISGMAGRDVAGGARTSAATTTLAAIGAAGLFLAPADRVGLRAGFAATWSLAAALHVGVIAATVRAAPARPPVVDPTAAITPRWPRRALEAGSLAYAAAAAVVVPLAYAGRIPLASAAHLVLVGFVITTIVSVAVHILPRFARAAMPAALLRALPPLILAGPALMALGLGGTRALLPAGAVVEAAGVGVFAACVIFVLARAHRFRVQDVAYAGAPVAVAIGGGIGLAFATTSQLVSQLATHALLNVFGFVGLFVLAASTDLYAPAVRPGAVPAKAHAAGALGLAMLGLFVAAIGTALAQGLVARAGMGVYAAAILWQLVGIVSSHRRAGRVLSRLGR